VLDWLYVVGVRGTGGTRVLAGPIQGGVLLQAAYWDEGIQGALLTAMERGRAAERKAFSMYTGWTEQRSSDDVMYKVTKMVIQNVCDVFVVG
jgi:hypothetical protein